MASDVNTLIIRIDKFILQTEKYEFIWYTTEINDKQPYGYGAQKQTRPTKLIINIIGLVMSELSRDIHKKILMEKLKIRWEYWNTAAIKNCSF